MTIDAGTRVLHKRRGPGIVKQWLPGRPGLHGFEFPTVLVDWDEKQPGPAWRKTSYVYEEEVEILK